MRILYACAYLPAEGISGGSARMFRIIRGMASRHEVHVLSFYEKDTEIPHVEELKSFCSTVRVIRRGQSLGEWRRDLFHLVPRSISLEFGNMQMRDALAADLNSNAYDLANIESLNMTQAMPKQRTVPAVLTHLEVYHRVVSQRLSSAKSPWDKFRLAAEWMRALQYELWACRQYDRVLTVSASEAESLNRWGPSVRIGYNNTGVDCEFFAPSPKAPEPGTITYVGYFRHKPNVDAVLHFYRRIFPRIQAKVPGARFIVIGGEPPSEVLQLRQDPAVTVTGWVKDFRPLIHQASVFAVPIISGAGLRGKVLEAWSMGKAVVSTHLGVDGLAAEDGVNALVADEPEVFADHVTRLLVDSNERRQLESAAVRTVRELYDWSITLAELDAEYHRVVESYAGRFTASGEMRVGAGRLIG